MTSPLVTIVTPTYNDAKYIHLAIDTVLRQPYDNFEMIIVNDGSTDEESLKILDKISDPKIRIIHQDNNGLPGARNAGIKAGTGKYILPLDADDRIAAPCLTRSVEVLEAKPHVAMVYGNIQIFGDEDRIVPTGRFNTYRILFGNYFHVGSMFRRSAWESVGGYTEEMIGFEDWEFWIKLIEKGWVFEKVDEVLGMHHVHGISFWDRSRPIYKTIISQIRSLHQNLYSKESIRRLKKENRITWVEDLIYHIPLPLRHGLGKSPLRRLVRIIHKMGLYRDL